VAAVQAGYPQAEIAEAAYAFQCALERGDRLMVGVNSHVSEEEDQVEIHHADPHAEGVQVERVRELRARRDPELHRDALARLRAACEGTENVMPYLIDAAAADATIGEVCDLFRDVWGRYRDPARW
jgi:methylmalonyl-CoA mutase N-terminal domain/subunit